MIFQMKPIAMITKKALNKNHITVAMNVTITHQ